LAEWNKIKWYLYLFKFLSHSKEKDGMRQKSNLTHAWSEWVGI
jgi:hypothetical protein